MNKKAKIIMLICLALLSLALIFTSCDESGDETTVGGITTAAEATDTSEPSEETTAPATEPTAPAEETTAPTAEAPHEHAWSDWTVTLDASCTAEGLKERTCACGEKETQAIAAVGHSEVIDAAVAPTCTSAGLTEGKHCANCNTVTVAQTKLDALGHTETVISAVPATCTQDGLEEGISCSVCNTVIKEQLAVPAIGHNAGDWITDKAATCTAKGSKHIECTFCGITMNTETISATGHTAGAWITDKVATCTSTGQRHNECKICGVTVKKETVSAKHTPGAWIIDRNATCTVPGEKHNVCTSCGSIAETEIIYAYGHTMVVDEEVRGSCTEDGLTEGRHCSVCNYVFKKQEVIKATGHSKIEEMLEAPTCGTLTYQNVCCTYCGTLLADKVALEGIGHKESDPIVDRVATCLQEGRSHTECILCDNIVTTTTSPTLPHTVVIDKAVAPTENSTGLTEGSHCSDCGTVIKAQEIVIALSHTAGEWIVDKTATVTEDGSRHQLCLTCGETVKTEVLYATGSAGLDYTFDSGSGTYAVSGKNCTDSTVYIPAYHNGIPVTKISSHAFMDFTNLKNIVFLGNNIKEIEKSAFQRCTNLVSMIIPDSVIIIGNNAFYECKALTAIVIPDSVTEIGDYAFSECVSVKSIKLGKGLKYIGKEAFYRNRSVSTLLIPSNVEIIGERAFGACSGITQLTISNGVKEIGDYGFAGLSSIKSITIPGSIKSIGDWAFGMCWEINEINIENGVESIGAYAFNCTKIKAITIPDSVVIIKEKAFFNCQELETVTIGDGVKTIENQAFYCEHLKKVTLGSSVESIGSEAFISVLLNTLTIPASLKYVDPNAFLGVISTLYLEDMDTWLRFISTNGNPIRGGGNVYVDGKLITSIVIPDGVTNIPDEAFMTWSNITSVTIPSSVTSIGRQAFSECTKLKSITIPESVTSIGDGAFFKCKSLTKITIPGSISSFGDWVFSECTSLASVTIKEGVTSIGSSEFSSCSYLATVTIPKSVDVIYEYAFAYSKRLKTVNFDGTVAEWYAITKGKDWNEQCPFTVVHCSDGDAKVS